MRKYKAWAYITFLNAFEYRLEVFLWQAIEIIPVLTMVFIWIKKNDVTPGGYTTSQMVTYYVMSLIISRIINFYFAEMYAQKIWNGDFSQTLLKPVSVFKAMLAGQLTKKILYFLISYIPVFVVVFFCLSQYILKPELQSVGWFAVLMLLANVITFLFQLLIMGSAFYLRNVEGLKHVEWILLQVFGGSILPLTFYPEWLQTISNWLPFKLLYFVPISIFIEGTAWEEALWYIGKSCLWIVLLWTACHLLWKKGLQKYGAFGG